jgi:hypothetical protein
MLSMSCIELRVANCRFSQKSAIRHTHGVHNYAVDDLPRLLEFNTDVLVVVADLNFNKWCWPQVSDPKPLTGGIAPDEERHLLPVQLYWRTRRGRG